MLPPMLLFVRVGSRERRGSGIWLPLFVVWLILLPIVVLAVLVTSLVDVVLLLVGQAYHHYTLLLVRGVGLLGATRGMVVSIRSKEDVVDIEIV